MIDQGDKTTARILVVDDEPSITDLVSMALRYEHFAVQVAHGGREAIVAVEDFSPDLVVLDVMMPIMDGYTAAVAIRNYPRTASLPILVVTAKGDMRHLFEAIPSVAGFFEKPFDPKDLRAAITKVTAGK